MSHPNPRRAVRNMAPYRPPTAGRQGKLRLDFNENTVGCSPRVIEALTARLSSEQLAIYPEYDEVRSDLARHFGVESDELLLTNGTDEAIQVFLNTYVDDGDQVISLRPSYAMYRFYAELAGATLREICYELPKLSFPLEAILDAISPQTRAVIIANPNNPTGTGVDLNAIEAILKRAAHAAVFIDEAYFPFSPVTAIHKLVQFQNLFISRTFSKLYGMAAMRIGALFSQKDNVQYLRKAQSPYSVNTLAAMAAAEAIQDQDYVQAIVDEVHHARELLYRCCEKLGITYIPSAANFVLIFVGERVQEIKEALAHREILVRDRSYELPGALRVTIGTREQTARALAELERIW